MDNKTFWLGFVAVYVVWQILGYLVHGVMLQEHYAVLADVFRPESDMMDKMWLMYVSSAVYLYLFCKIFTVGYENKGVMEGVRFGLLLGLFFSIPAAMDQYVVYPVTEAIAGLWFIAGVISFMIAGAVFAAIYRPSRV
jgi:hypothetical protein